MFSPSEVFRYTVITCEAHAKVFNHAHFCADPDSHFYTIETTVMMQPRVSQ